MRDIFELHYIELKKYTKTYQQISSALDRMFDEEERLVYETWMQSLADVESKIASAEEKGKEAGIEITKKQIVLN